MPEPGRIRRLGPALLGLAAIFPLLGWWFPGLFDLDEGYYAAVVAEMNARHEWIVPYLNGKPWFEKPILLYWCAKPCALLFGGELGLRLPSVLACVALYVLLAKFGDRFLGGRSGLAAAAILGTCLLFAAVGRLLLVDPLLVLFLSLALLAFWRSLVESPRWRLLAGACLGAAVLAKGPVALVLFAGVAGFTWWRERELRPKFRGFWLAGTALLLLVVASWYVPAYLRSGQTFVHDFLVEQNLDRFRGGDEAHSVGLPLGLIYYLPVLLLGMFPWSLGIVRAWPRRGDPSPQAPLRRFLAAWAVVVVGFFTLSGSKLPHYVLPAFPPLALLLGEQLARRVFASPGPVASSPAPRAAGPLAEARAGAIALFGAALCAALALGLGAYHAASQVDAGTLRRRLEALPPNPSRRLALFRLNRRPASEAPQLPSPRVFGLALRVNETGAPSLLSTFAPDLYPARSSPEAARLTSPAIESDDLADLLSALGERDQLFVVTRPGRFRPAELRTLAARGVAVAPYPPSENGLFQAFLLTPKAE